jgi:hypothetical protein
MLRRPQFRLSIVLWLTLAVACWFGGMAVERKRQMALWDDYMVDFLRENPPGSRSPYEAPIEP